MAKPKKADDVPATTEPRVRKIEAVHYASIKVTLSDGTARTLIVSGGESNAANAQERDRIVKLLSAHVGGK